MIDLEGKSPEELKALLELVETLKAQEEALNPLCTFVPNGKQEELIRAVGTEDEHWIYVIPAANSIGKSAVSIAILGNFIWGPQNEWFQYPRFKEWKFPKKCWYISEQSTLKDFVCGVTPGGDNSEIGKWFPKGKFRFDKSGYDYNSRLTSDTKWTVTFKTFDMDVSKFESDKVGLIIFDEPPPETIFNAAVARLTMGGIILMPMTPLYSSAWVKDRLVDPGLPHVFILYADIEANCLEHGTRGRIPHEQIQQIISQYDPDERGARASGLFAHLVGLVFKGLHPDHHRHDRGPETFDQKHFRIYNVIDPHDSKPPAIIWGAVDKFGRPYVIDEFPYVPKYKPFIQYKAGDWKLVTREVCEEIRNIETRNGWDKPNKIVRVMDPNFGKKPDAFVGKTTQQIFAKIGQDMKYPLNFSVNVDDDLEDGHRLVRDLFQIKEDPDLNPDHKALMTIGKNCYNVWHALTNYSRKERSGKSLEIDGPSENVGQKYKDFVDPIRYYIEYLRKMTDTDQPSLTVETQDDFVHKVVIPRLKRRATRGKKNWAQL